MKNKEAAIQFLTLVVSGQIDEAYQKYVDMDGKHHNVYFPAGFGHLQQAMKDNHVQFPNKRFTIKRALADEDLVAVHSHMALKPGEIECIVVHLFRFKDGKIVEMWDCGQVLQGNIPNADGAF